MTMLTIDKVWKRFPEDVDIAELSDYMAAIFVYRNNRHGYLGGHIHRTDEDHPRYIYEAYVDSITTLEYHLKLLSKFRYIQLLAYTNTVGQKDYLFELQEIRDDQINL